MEAKTIHRLLEIDPGTGRFTRNDSNTLACGLLVVDETSMVDVPLMHSLGTDACFLGFTGRLRI